MKSNKEKVFWIKIIQNELPTLNNLTIRRPKLYHNHQRCFLCLVEKETREHLFTCPMAQTNLKSIWKETENQLLDKGRKSNESSKILKSKRHLLDKIKRKTIGLPQEYLKVFSGLIRRKDVKE